MVGFPHAIGTVASLYFGCQYSPISVQSPARINTHRQGFYQESYASTELSHFSVTETSTDFLAE